MDAPLDDMAAVPQRGGALNITLVTETYPPEVNGVAMTIGRMVDGLLARGHRVQLVRPRQHRSEAPCDGELLQEVLTWGVPIPVYRNLRFGLASPMRLASLWRRARPDLVHVVTEGPLGWSAVRAARRLRIPLSSGFHTNFHSYTRHYRVGLLHRPVAAYLRRLHAHTAATFVPTRALATELAGIGYDNVMVVSRGVDALLFQPARRSRELREAWGLGDDGLAVLYVGRLAEEKNVRLVQRSFEAIRRVNPRTRLVFVGDGPLRAELQSACPHALFAGIRTGVDLAAHYASADLFLFPSLTETFGNVTTEAMASGVAVVAFDQAAAGDLIADGCNGRVVSPGDAGAFVRAATDVACDMGMCRAMGRAARDTVASLHWDAIHDRVIHALRSIALGRSALSPEFAAATHGRRASAGLAAGPDR